MDLTAFLAEEKRINTEAVRKSLRDSSLTITLEGNPVTFEQLDTLKAEDMTRAKVVLNGAEASFHSAPLLRDLSDLKPSGRVIATNWRGFGFLPIRPEPGLTAKDLIAELYGHSRCYDPQEGWRI